MDAFTGSEWVWLPLNLQIINIFLLRALDNVVYEHNLYNIVQMIHENARRKPVNKIYFSSFWC